MKNDSLCVYWNLPAPSDNAAGQERMSLLELRSRVLSGRILTDLARYRDVELLVERIETVPRPFLVAAILRWMSRRRCRIVDSLGRKCEISLAELFHRSKRFAQALPRCRSMLRHVEQDVSHLEGAVADGRLVRFDRAGQPLYLRTDDVYGIQSGGSIGHIAGVLNHLHEFTSVPCFFTTDAIPTVREAVATHVLPFSHTLRDFEDVPSLEANRLFCDDPRLQQEASNAAMIYQRYSRYNYTGLALAIEKRLPFVLEYNGSEVWISANWGHSLRYPKLAKRIELANLRGADLVVVVSDVMREELESRGIPAEKILVNPNGVDPQRYSPQADGSKIRRQHRLEAKTVIGFIGTFGPWHGAEVLAEAFGTLLRRHPHYREEVRLMLIGDGVKMQLVREILAREGITDICALPGRVPQEAGPSYLAACDILASPHVPNPDGSRFFGSPTKLFEYMAMGKGIVASRLEQIGDVLAHGETAWLVEPGSVDALVDGLKVLLDDESLRERLGAAARREAVDKYTWKQHTGRIIAALQERCQ